MFYCLTTILSIIFHNSLICLSFVIEIFYFQTVPGTKHHRLMYNLTFSAMASVIRHQKDSGRQSIYKGENLYDVSCILTSHKMSSFASTMQVLSVLSKFKAGALCQNLDFRFKRYCSPCNFSIMTLIPLAQPSNIVSSLVLLCSIVN